MIDPMVSQLAHTLHRQRLEEAERARQFPAPTMFAQLWSLIQRQQYPKMPQIQTLMKKRGTV